MADIICYAGQEADFQSPVEIALYSGVAFACVTGLATLCDESFGLRLCIFACVDINHTHGCGFAFCGNELFPMFLRVRRLYGLELRCVLSYILLL